MLISEPHLTSRDGMGLRPGRNGLVPLRPNGVSLASRSTLH